MSLQIWLPLNGDLHNQGLSNITLTSNGTPSVDNNGKIGKCYSFNGSSYFQSNETFLNNMTACSLSCWVKDIYTGTSWMRIFGIGEHTRVHLDTNGSGQVRFFVSKDGTTGTYWGPISKTNIKDSTWHHVCGTFDNHFCKIYIDGKCETSVATNALSTVTGGKLYLGHVRDGIKLNGALNDVRIYDHCLSVKEVEEISKGLVLHYKLDQPANINYNLYTGSKNFTGSWVNGSAWTTSLETYNGFTVKQKSTVWGGLAQNITAINGDIFTISFWGKVDSGGNILSIHRSSLGNVTTGLTILDGNFSTGTNWINTTDNGTQWKRYWATLQITSSDITYLQWRIENSIADKNLYIAGLTLEKGYGTKNWSLSASEAGTTNIVYDSSGYGNNGTVVGPLEITTSSSRYSCATKFDGVTSCIKIPYNEINPDRIFTVNLWFYKDALGSKGYETLFGGPSGFEMDTRAGSATSLSLYMASVRGGNVYSPLNLNKWTMITMARDGTNEFYYVNGELKKTIEAKSMPSGQYRIGAWASDTGQNYYGEINDFRIYATVLTAEQVKELYNTSATIDKNGNIYARELVE